MKLIVHFRRSAIQFRKTNLSWDDILRKTADGYSSENILNKCRDSLSKVRDEEYPYERDSVLFKEKEIFFPLLSSLLLVCIKEQNALNLIDFGGSLGSAYFQNKEILKQSEVNINWNIVEQENFVECGLKYFANNELHFYKKIDECCALMDISVCLFSSVLQYLKNPYSLIDNVIKKNIKYMIIDRTIFIENGNEDILSIQTVPKEIYEASYPVWFLSLNKFLTYMEKNFEIIYKWTALDQHKLKGYKTIGLGFLFVKK
ncbi:methyltransferase, TIGR04325 family protein [Spirochaetia bacterium]|nr:methyltransferase, TIGR04325 family protein [Spirochaetia bacterium]